MRKRQNAPISLFKDSPYNSLLLHFSKIAVLLEFGNQAGAQREIERLYQHTLFDWYKHRLVVQQDSKDDIIVQANFIILYILGHIQSDFWRRAFWYFLQNFSLPEIKLNEVRDFKIVKEREIVKLLKESFFGRSFIIGWKEFYLQNNDQKKLVRQLNLFSVEEITLNNLEAFLPYRLSLNHRLHTKIKTLISQIKDPDFLQYYNLGKRN